MKLETRICKKTATSSTGTGGLKSSSANAAGCEKKGSKKAEAPTRPTRCVDWSRNDEIYFVSDDHQLLKLSSPSSDSVEVAKLPEDFMPTDLHWGIRRGDNNGDTLLITSNDGRFIILNKNFVVENTISAHTAAISSGRWSPDAAGLLTAGKDGMIKIWSRSGMLRSMLIQSDEPVECARWAPNSKSIVFCQGSDISVKPLADSSTLLRWRAHDGFVLALSWSSQFNFIASGGQDFLYKIWDSQGVNLFTSSTEAHAISALAFNPQNDLLLVSSCSLLKLCDTAGCSYSTARFKKPEFGSFQALSWSSDGNQVAGATSTGQIIMAFIVEKQLFSRNLKVTTTGRNSLRLEDTDKSSREVLDFTDRIIVVALDYGHLIVATSHHLHIYNEKDRSSEKEDLDDFACDRPFTTLVGEEAAQYSTGGLIGKSINEPILVDGRLEFRAIQLGKKFFLVYDWTSIWVYDYTGHLHLNPLYTGIETQMPLLNCHSISLGLNTLVILDNSDTTVLHIFDLITEDKLQKKPFTRKLTIQMAKIAACRAGTADYQFVAMIDENSDLYIMETRNQQSIAGTAADEIYKIGTGVNAVKWASESNMLVGVHDTCYSIWYCPGEGASDPTIIALTTVTIDATEFGKNILIESFDDSIVAFRCSGVTLPMSVNMLCEILQRNLSEGQWQQALTLCRINQNAYVWALLAAVAKRNNQLEISKEAYAAAIDIEKVRYLQHIKTLDHSHPEYMADNAFMQARLSEAKTILLNNQKYGEALSLCLRLHNWRQAVEIAQTHVPDQLTVIMEQRQEYLSSLMRKEWDTLLIDLLGKAKPE